MGVRLTHSCTIIVNYGCEAHPQLHYHCELWVWGSPTVALSLWIMGVRLTHTWVTTVRLTYSYATGCEAHSHFRYWMWGSRTFLLLNVRLTHIYIMSVRLTHNWILWHPNRVAEHSKDMRLSGTQVTISDHTHWNSHPARELSMYFNVKTVIKATTFMKGCWSLLANNCYAKGSELTHWGSIHSCDDMWVDHKVQKVSDVSKMTQWINFVLSFWISG